MAGKKLAAYVHVGGQVFAPGDTPPKEFADQITNPKAWEGGNAPSTSNKADDSDPGYSKSKVDDLKAEIEKRNEGREDEAKLSTDGVKADLVKVLETDDKAQAEA